MCRSLENTEVKIIVTSPLSRAVETAEIISDSIGGSKIIIDDGLIERDFGRLSGYLMIQGNFDTFGLRIRLNRWTSLVKGLLIVSVSMQRNIIIKIL